MKRVEVQRRQLRAIAKSGAAWSQQKQLTGINSFDSLKSEAAWESAEIAYRYKQLRQLKVKSRLSQRIQLTGINSCDSLNSKAVWSQWKKLTGRASCDSFKSEAALSHWKQLAGINKNSRDSLKSEAAWVSGNSLHEEKVVTA